MEFAAGCGQRSFARVGRHLGGMALLAGASLCWAADPQISAFNDNPDPVAAGGLYNYSARVDNNAPDAATHVRIVLPVPAGAVFVSASSPCVLVLAQVECDLGTVGANGADVRDLSFTFRALGPGPALINATATLTSSNDVNPANNVQTQATTVINGADLRLAKSGTPNPVVGGAAITYTLTPTNAGPNDSGPIIVVDNLPPSVSFVSASGPGWTCTHANGVVTCSRVGPHPVGPIVPITLVGTVNALAGTITNSASVTPALPGGVPDPDNSNNTATVDTTVLPGADVRIAQKRVTSGLPARAGQNATFEIQSRNAGPSDAANVVVRDPLPDGWTFISASGPGWACAALLNVVTCTRALLPAGNTDNISIVALAPDSATVGPTGRTDLNSASISSATADPTPGNNNGSVQVQILPDSADLRLSKVKTPNPVALNAHMLSTIRVTNGGSRVATGPLRVVEVLTGETFVSASGIGWTCVQNANTIVCDHPNTAGLAVNATLPTLTFDTIATVAGIVSNTACTGSSIPPGAAPGTLARPPAEGDLNPGNDCATTGASATVIAPDLAITKTTSTPTGNDKTLSATEGSVTYTLVVTNVTSPGTDAATGVLVRDSVPAFINGRSSINAIVPVVSAGNAVFNCNIAAAVVSCAQSFGQLRPGEFVTIPITVNRPLLDGSFVNTATLSNTVQGDPNALNNSASDTLTIAPMADVQLTGKSVNPASIRAGENATYVISLRNNGPSSAANVLVKDDFNFPPGDTGLTVISVASTKAGATCNTAANAQLNAASPGFSCTLGTLANGEVQTVTLVVRPNFVPGNGVRNFGNTANISTTTAENANGSDNGNNSFSAVLTVTAAAVDLLVNKIDFEDPVAFNNGAAMNYRVRVTSNGPSLATQVRIVEHMQPPPGKRIRFVCDTVGAAASTCNAVPLCSVRGVDSAPGVALPDFTCSVPAGTAATGLAVGDLMSGRSKDIFLRFLVLDQPATNGDVYVNSATVQANEPDNFPGNNSTDEQTTARQRIDLAVAKSASPTSLALRQPFVWTVVVTNNGPGHSLITDLSDTLPAGVTITGPITFSVTTPLANGTCGMLNNRISCALGQVNSGARATISIAARIDSFPPNGQLTNTASVDTDPNKIGGIDPVPGNNTANSTITVTRSSISGIVFEDRDRVGANAGTAQAANLEPRISGVSVRLTGSDAFGNAVDLLTSTDVNGNYRFDNLSPANATGYALTQTQPGAFNNSPANPPTQGVLAPSAGGSYSSGGVAGDSAYSGIALGVAQDAINYHFPELRRPSLSGFVYLDRNVNASRDAANDPPLVGATLRLLSAATSAVLATTSTAADGSYSFSNLDPQTLYTLEQPLPTSPGGLRNGAVNPGLIGGAACVSGCLAQSDTPTANTDRIANIDLSSGADGTQFNFGENQLTSISGLVFVDANRNATLDGSDTARLVGVTLRLVQGADCSSGSTLQTTTSAADGSYRFDNLPALQDYRVCETQPAGYGIGSARGVANSNDIVVTALPPSGSGGNDFGETLGSLAGSVYADYTPGNPALSNNGQRDAGEAGIANVAITLTGTDMFGNPVNRTAFTDASGNYVFDGLLPANAAGYTLSEGAIPPAAGTFNDGLERVGGADGSAAVNDVISAIALVAGQQASGYLFGELPTAPISGTVYIDRNRNAGLDAQPVDGRLGGVTLRLFDGLSCSGEPRLTQVSANDGSYLFSGLAAGQDYSVCELQPVGYGNGATQPGVNGSSPVADHIRITALPLGGSPNNHFGETVGSISGTLFLDAANDGSPLGDAPLVGVTVTLSGTDATGALVNRSTVTNSDGGYRFADLLAAGPGGYSVTEQAAQPLVSNVATLNGRTNAGTAGGTASAVAQTPSAVSAITLAAGADASGYDFGEILPVSLSGTVFLDGNDNGIQDLPGDTGLPGVSIIITGIDDTGAAVNRSIVTGPDGRYSLADLRPGTYSISEPNQPGSTSNGRTVAGSAGGTATPVSTLPSAISAIVLTTPGTVSINNNFAERPSAAALAGQVWLDANANGVRDLGDGGLASITVELSGTTSLGQAVTRSAVTDANGNYRFDNLAPGSYTVTEPAQPPGTVNGLTLPGSTGGSATGLITQPSAISAIALGVNQQSVGNDFAEVPAASISGQVWVDRNDDGIVSPGESGLSGVTLVLTGTDDLGRAVSITVVTDANGNYSFSGLRPGVYTVTEPIQPSGTLDGRTLPGSSGGTATGRGVPPSAISAINLLPGAQSVNNNFAELGQSSDLQVSKQAIEARFTVGFPAHYRISVRNAGELASNGVITLRDILPTGLTLDATPSGSGWTCVGAPGASRFDCGSAEVIAAGASSANPIDLTLRVTAAALAATPAHNLVLVEGGGEAASRAPSPAERAAFDAGNANALPLCQQPAVHNVCRVATPVQNTAAISGTVWYDIGNTPGLLDAGDRRLAGWAVEIIDTNTGVIVGRATSAADGSYRIAGLLPGVPLAVRFRDPGSGVVFGYPVNGESAPGSSGAVCDPANALLNGAASSCVARGLNPQLTVVLAAGQELTQQSLPVDPSGVVYDSASRAPVPGSVVTLAPIGTCVGWNPAQQIVGAGLGGYTLSSTSIAMTVGSDGLYQFLFGGNAPASCTFGITVTPPLGYLFQSSLIPPQGGTFTPPGGPNDTVAVQPQAAPPSAPIGAGTRYFLAITAGSGVPGIIHNHIPLDPAPPAGLTLSKIGDKAVAELGDSLRYTITVQLTTGRAPQQVSVVDRLPAGLTFIAGTAMVDGQRAADPLGTPGPRLIFNLGPMGAANRITLQYRVRIGVGSAQGDGTNRAQAWGCGVPTGCVDPLTGAALPIAAATNEGRHRVRVTGGVFGTDACIVGKVFVDCNGNHIQDAEELGIPGVRLVLQDGMTLISDSEGKYSMCGLPPKSHVLRIDPHTLPRGARLTTSSNRNLGDAGSLWLDLKHGALQRADFVEGSCSTTLLTQVKARRAQGEVRAPETERKTGPALRFDSQAHGRNALTTPQQGTDGATQAAPRARSAASAGEGGGDARR